MITVFHNVAGPIRELHGVNCAPYEKSLCGKQKYVDEIFGYCGTPRSRLHDCCGAYGGTYYVDIPNIFRDFSADENAPESYDFHYTDEYIAAIIKTGAQIVYRLGVTIEFGSKKYTANPPENFGKWARVCEHIVRHYNEGWNDGFHYNIEYWEIWNEPENPPMWTGTREQFFELYKTASLHLKKCFPQIKIGGYGSCGFYTVVRPQEKRPLFLTFVPYFTEFLAYVKQNGCPLDFFSWHIYTSKVEELEGCAAFVRRTLDGYGFTATESHCNEWNYGGEGGGFKKMDTLVGASYCAAALSVMQRLGVDKAQYYCLSIQSSYNGFVYLRTTEWSPVVHVFAAFNLLFRAGKEIAVTAGENAPYCVAAAAEDGTRYILLSHYGKAAAEETIAVENGKGKYLHVFELRDASGWKHVRSVAADEPVTVSVSENGIYFVTVDRFCDPQPLFAKQE